VIPHDRLRRICLRRGFSSCTMRREYIILFDYLDASQKERELSAVLTTPPTAGGQISGHRLNRMAASNNAVAIKGILAEALPTSAVFVADV